MKQIKLFLLSCILLSALTANSQIYTQGFNGGSIPADWATLITNGTYPPAITFVTTSSYPSGLTPTEGTHMVSFNSYDCSSGQSIRLYQTVPFATTGGLSSVNVNFDWATDNAYSSNDRVVVQYSLDGTNWVDVNTYSRASTSAAAWNAISCPLPAGALNQATVYLGFHFISAYGNNCHLDNLSINGSFSPVLSFSPTSLPFGYTAYGNSSAEQSFSLSGINLSSGPGSIVVTAPTSFLVSLTSGSGYSSSVNVPYNTTTLNATPIYVIFQPAAAMTAYSGNITLVGGGDSKNLPVTGTSALTYCSSVADNANDEEIYSVTVNGATNAYSCSTIAPGPGSVLNEYSNFTTLGSLFSLEQATAVPFTILEDECDGATYYKNGCAIWIDFNQDGDFEDAGENVYLEGSTVQGPRTISGNILVPLTATPGITTMRIIVAEGVAGADFEPCLSYGYGETEDYYVTINATTATCLIPTNLNLIQVTDNAAHVSWTENNSATTWQIEYGPHGFTHGTGTRNVVASNPASILSLAASTAYDLYIRSICAEGDTSAWSPVLQFSTLCPPFTIPFLETFDASTIPLCWSMSGPDVWHFETGWPNYGAAGVTDHTGNSGSYAGVDGSSPYPVNDVTLNTPYINVAGAVNPTLDFWLFNDNINDDFFQTLQIDLWNGNSWVNKIYYYDSAQNNAAWQHIAVSIRNQVITGPVQFRLLVDKSDDSPYNDDIIIDDFKVYDAPYLDLAVVQGNVNNCDTAGLFAPPIHISNFGNVLVPSGTNVDVTYIVNGGTPVVETLALTSDLTPGGYEMLSFTTPYDFDAFTTYNGTFAVSFIGDADLTNDTVDFTVTFHALPVVNLGHDTTVCADATIQLDAGNPGATYSWWNSSTSSTISLDSSFCHGIGTCTFWVDVENTNGCTKRDTINITWTSCAGISEMTSAQVSIMPNPSSGTFTIDFGGLTGITNIDISDLTGKTVISETLELSGAEKHNYDLSSFGKGIYNIRIVNSNQVAIRKIVVN